MLAPTMPTRDALRLPSIEGLRAIDAAARHGSFERAADELALSASAVAKRVAAVESLLATPLFQRGAKALALTAAGREYLPQVRAALALLAAVPLHRRALQRRQRLRVVLPPTFARQIVAPRLAAFSAAMPEVELELLLSIPFLASGTPDADLEVRLGDAAELGGDELMRDRVLPLAAPALLAAHGPLRAPQDLAGLPLLRTPLEPWAPWFRAAALDWPEPDTGPKLVDLGLVLEAAAAGAGVALARPSLARRWLARGELVAPLALSSLPRWQYRLLRPAGQSGASADAAAAFADWLRAACADEQAAAAALLPGG